MTRGGSGGAAPDEALDFHARQILNAVHFQDASLDRWPNLKRIWLNQLSDLTVLERPLR